VHKLEIKRVTLFCVFAQSVDQIQHLFKYFFY